MKQPSSIRSLLGISQEDMAGILQVPRSQLAMFETGKRDLPRAAKLLLAPMLVHATQAKLKPAPDTTFSDTKKLGYLDGLLKENELQRLRLARKLQSTRKLYERNQTIMNFTTYLMDSENGHTPQFKTLVSSIQSKARQALNDCNPMVILQYEIKAELLEVEKLLLEEFKTKYTPEKELLKVAAEQKCPAK